MAQPLQRFLGLDDANDARGMLGLPAETLSLPQVDAALRRQLARIHKHPDGNSAEGDLVKQLIRDAAQKVKLELIQKRQAAPQQPSAAQQSPATEKAIPTSPPARIHQRAVQQSRARPAIQLTDFDRAVLAVLVGCGGWNAECRSRLVALSSVYGVSVQGLMRVITGLSNYARSGGARLGVAEIAGDESRMAAPSVSIPDSVDEASDLLSRLLPEIKEDSLWSRMKLIVLFSIITIIATLLVLRVLLTDATPRNSGFESTVKAQIDASGSNGSPETAMPVSRRASAGVVGPAEFTDPPTFLGSGVPMEVVDAADEAPGLADQFDLIARQLTVNDQPAEAVNRNWAVSVETIARGWLLADQATCASIRSTIFDALFAASRQPSISDDLLGEFMPPSGNLADPIDVVRGTYRAGMLGQIAGANLPPIVTERARSMLDIAVGTASEPGLTTFEGAARKWLIQSLPNMVERAGYDSRAFDYWELWISVVRAVHDDAAATLTEAQVDDAYLRALIAVLYTEPDLTIDNPPARIVGRLVRLLDVESNPTVRDSVLALFENERISAQDLWILTSILLEYRDQPWMSDDLALPPNADIPHRRRIAARWRAQWPEPAALQYEARNGIGDRLNVDTELYTRWNSALTALSNPQDDASDFEQLRHIIALSLLNEAAGAMMRQDVATAGDILDGLTDDLLASASSPDDQGITARRQQPSVVRLRPGQALGFDGQWAAQYEQAARNTGEKLNLLGALRNSAGTDLGPIDARVFIAEVYRGSPQDVRALAQSVLVDQFATGPRVALELLDQSMHAPASRELRDAIIKLTSQPLPPARAPSWPVKLRFAIVEHALALQLSNSNAINDAAVILSDTYCNRAKQIARTSIATIDTSDPAIAAAQLRDAWQSVAANLISTAPTPDDLPGLARRHDVRLNLVRGPVQHFVANQIAIAELLAFVTTAERPASRDTVVTLLRWSALIRSNEDSVLDQSIAAEQVTARLWQVRMGATADATQSSEEDAR